MKKIHALAIALLLAASAALGVAAATRTVGLGRSSQPTVTNAAVAVRAHRLDRVEAALRRAMRDRPPALPTVPAAATPAAAAPASVIYRRPAPIVVIKHGARHEAEAEHEGGGESD